MHNESAKVWANTLTERERERAGDIFTVTNNQLQQLGVVRTLNTHQTLSNKTSAILTLVVCFSKKIKVCQLEKAFVFVSILR